MTQLRPAARQLSPTLQDLSKLAPDLKALFPTSTRCSTPPRRACPATEDFLDELHPLLANFDAPLRQLNPPLLGLGQYKNELSAFFANTVATTQATTQEGNARVHYLRTSNPANPENLAVYPRRLAHEPPQPVHLPRRVQEAGRGAALLRDPPVRGGPGPDARDPAAAGPADRSDLADPGRPGGQHAEVLLRPR